MTVHARVQEADFSPEAELAPLQASGAGGIAMFLGVARAAGASGPVHVLELEHYPGMTEASLHGIALEAQQRWDLLSARIVHRVGRIGAGERIVFVGAAARHRGPAFEACEYMIDQLKTRAPFWKREEGPRGAAWVEAREDDEQASRRWSGDAGGEEGEC